jgi:ornithine carbamoyltransferase
MKRNLVSDTDLEVQDIEDIFRLTSELKSGKRSFSNALSGKTVALVFQKPSNRTRVSFEVGILQLGGHSIYLGPDDIKLGMREATKDVARTLSRYVDAIVARTFAHSDVVELASSASVPVINGLSDLLHPCQALSDVYTVLEKKGRLKGIRFGYIGDGNNVLHSLLYECSRLGIEIAIATPGGYEPDKKILDESYAMAKVSGATIIVSNSPIQAARGCDVLYTDVWTSMGQEQEREKRLFAFRGFQINSEILSYANAECIVMHCLPAHRGEEITDEVIDGQHSVVFDQAENRMHVQKAILIKLLG